MALKLDTIRLLVADDVGIGKTIEAGLIARELLDRGEIERLAVICPPHLCEQWQRELAEKFAIDAEVVRTGTATRLERGLRPDESVFDVHPYTVVSLDYIKSDRRRDDFLRACPDFVIVDEAHACVQSNTSTRHQRYQLLKGLAASEPRRHMVFLTATPHSGDDTAFHNLLGLLEPKFTALADAPEGETRRRLREQLALHFVQRRRGDIAEWKDHAGFPVRESREATYRLTGDWGGLFDDVLAYARTMVDRTADGTRLQQRMSWWAALALLRCASSSPAAASLALRTRLQAAEGDTEDAKVEHLDRTAGETVLDETDDDSLALTESVPAGTVEAEDAVALRQLIDRADALRGPRNDPKLKTLIEEVRQLVLDGFRPVVFCRYIATAHYVGHELKQALGRRKTPTSPWSPGNSLPISAKSGSRHSASLKRSSRQSSLPPTACPKVSTCKTTSMQSSTTTSPGIRLATNSARAEPTVLVRASRTVRALMLYGENNPVDGAVLRVILRKAEKIRKELGVSVPLPADNNKVVDAIMKAVLLHGGSHTQAVQNAFDFGDTEAEVDDAWQTAASRMARTVFAQRRLTPDDVLPEWRKAVSVLGGPEDVARFVRLSAERLGAPLDARNGCFRLPVGHLPKPLQDRLDAIGFTASAKIAFGQPAPAGAAYIHRAHPLVATLADFISDKALDADAPDVAARTGAMFTAGVRLRTVLYLLRLRSQIILERRGADGRYLPLKSLLAEECLGIAIQGDNSGEPLTEDDALSLLSLEPARNMPKDQKTLLVRQALSALPELENTFERLAQERARRLLADHRRIRDASDARGLRYDVVPALPVDKIGVYVFMPMANF